MSTPVTVLIRREAEPEHVSDAVDWIEEGLALARESEGCLGGGVMRDEENENVLHAMCCFTDEQALVGWEASERRHRWLDHGEPLVREMRIQRRTGVEGWFDGPQVRSAVDSSTGSVRTVVVRAAPVRWKQACAIWIGMFPMNALTSWIIAMLPWWGDMPILMRSAIVVTVLAPVMTFVMMPTVTRALRPWLRRRPGAIRTERFLLDALDSRATEMQRG